MKSSRIGLGVSILGIGLLGLLIYSNTFHASFHFDDYGNIVNNPATRGLSRAGRLWKENRQTFVAMLSYAMNYSLSGLNVLYFHTFNFLIHLANSILVMLFVRLALAGIPSLPARERDGLALFSGLIFLSHPLQTEAVTYIVQRNASLAAFFYIGSLYSYARYRRGGGRPAYFLSLASCALAFFTKPNTYTLPLALWVYDLCFHGKERENFRSAADRLWPFFALLGVVYFSIYHESVASKGFGRAFRESPRLSRSAYFLTEINVLRTYLRLLVFPRNQNLDYDYPVSRSFFEPKTLLSAALLIGILGFAVWMLQRRRRLAAFGIFWFFVTLSVESTILPINDVIFEHRLYLPMLGVAACLTEILWDLLKQRRNALVILGCLILSLLSFLTYRRNQAWATEVGLWQDVVKKSPAKARPLNNLGWAYRRAGEKDRALALFEQAIRLDPDYVDSYVNAAGLYSEKGRSEEAVRFYEKAAALDPELGEPYDNLGKIYAERGDLDKAEAYFKKALEVNSQFVNAYSNLGVLYNRKGDVDKEIEYYQKAVELDPAYKGARRNLGIAYGRKGDYELAILHLKKAAKIDPQDADIHYNLGVAYGKKGDREGTRHEVETLEKLGRSDWAEKLETSYLD